MAESAAQLIVAIVALVWLPGWLLNSRLGWPRDVVPSLFSGTSLHIVLIFCVTSVTHRVASSTLATLIVTAIVVVLFALQRPVPTRHEVLQERMRPMLWPGVLIGVLVGAAAVMRLFHNYHYDDFQHLVYLTEVIRHEQLFPVELMRFVELPGLTGGIYVSRYPLWAAVYAVWAHATGAPIGDVYYFLGLALLALSLSSIVYMCGVAAGGGSAGLATVLVILCSSLVLSDDLLNYGGYPFQVGKLFLLVGGAAACAYGRVQNGIYLLYTFSGLLLGPLLHANNIIGSAIIASAVGVYWLIRRQWFTGLAIPLGAASVWILVGVTALGTQSFMKWPSVTDSVASTRTRLSISTTQDSMTPERSPSVNTVEARLPQSVLPTLALFIRRALPLEAASAFIWIVVLSTLRNPRIRRIVVVGSCVCALGLVAANSLLTTGRLILINAFKPGFFSHRGALAELQHHLSGVDAITDPITAVYGSAAGWELERLPGLTTEEQFMYLLLFHPSVRGGSLRMLLSRYGIERVLVNEAITGPGVAAKFEDIGANVVWREGEIAPGVDEVEKTFAEFGEAVYRLNYVEASRIVASSHHWFMALLTSRPVMLLSVPFAREHADTGDAGLPVGDIDWREADGALAREQFLNSVLVRVRVPDGCYRSTEFVLKGDATFDDTVLIHRVDSRVWKTIGMPVAARVFPGKTVRGRLEYERGVCAPGSVTFFLHGGYLYDFRFSVESVSWHDADREGQHNSADGIGRRGESEPQD